MELVEIRYLLDLLEGEPELKLKLLVDDAATEDEMWEIIRERDEEFAQALESGWEDRNEIILVDSEDEKEAYEGVEVQINPRSELLDHLYKKIQVDIEESGPQDRHRDLIERVQHNVKSEKLEERWEDLLTEHWRK